MLDKKRMDTEHLQKTLIKFHTQNLTHTLKDTILYNVEYLRALRFLSSITFFKHPLGPGM